MKDKKIFVQKFEYENLFRKLMVCVTDHFPGGLGQKELILTHCALSACLEINKSISQDIGYPIKDHELVYK